jgi:hypothetical protein
MTAPRERAISAAHAGCVATNAVDEATEVNRRLVIHVAKCAASKTPAPPISCHSKRRSVRSRAPRRHNATGSKTPAAAALRQNAIAKAGAAVAAINGPDVETAVTATAMSNRSVCDGAANSGLAAVATSLTQP